MAIPDRDRLAEEIREMARPYCEKDLSDLNQKVGRDLGIDDLDFYDFLADLSHRFGVDVVRVLEVRAPLEVKPWSLRSLTKALRRPGLIEDPTLARLVELVGSSREKCRFTPPAT